MLDSEQQPEAIEALIKSLEGGLLNVLPSKGGCSSKGGSGKSGCGSAAGQGDLAPEKVQALIA